MMREGGGRGAGGQGGFDQEQHSGSPMVGALLHNTGAASKLAD